MTLQVLRRLAAPIRAYNARQYSTPSPQHSIYISNSTNPYFNLTFEDWLFRHKAPEEPLLLIYRDEPCVIIGRNQNPWKEVNFEALRARPEIPLIRRRSGGGTVYHDLGNTNFSIHLPRQRFDRHITAQTILRAVRSLGINAHVNERNDICVGKDKVSGSAYKIVNKRAYHHGTMLISSRLDTLGDLLRPTKETMITRGVASVRSPVSNLSMHNSIVTHDTFTNAVVDEFRKEYDISSTAQIVEESDQLKSVEFIRQGLAELPSWEWAFGQTPEFSYTVERAFPWGNVVAEIRSKHGIINACTLRVTDTDNEATVLEAFGDIGESLKGKLYGFLGDSRDDQGQAGPRREISTWIKDVINV